MGIQGGIQGWCIPGVHTRVYISLPTRVYTSLPTRVYLPPSLGVYLPPSLGVYFPPIPGCVPPSIPGYPVGVPPWGYLRGSFLLVYAGLMPDYGRQE